MENQERHNKKIELLSKCIEAGVINLQDALMLLDADVVPEEPATSGPGDSKWNGIQGYPTRPRTFYPQTGINTFHPLGGTVTIPSAEQVHTGTINTLSGTITTSNYPAGTNVTYTSTSSSPGETLLMHANTIGSVATNTKQ